MIQFEDAAIKCENLTKSFGDKVVLDNLNFDVPKGKITTILGFSGAGKSTLMKLVLGLIQPTSGKMNVLGNDLSTFNKYELREFRKKFGMVFQYAALFDSLSAFENVAFPMREFTDFTDAEIESKSAGILNSVGIAAESHHNLPSELSGGMRKRVGLARALALEPDVMLYDEPTTGLDPITTKKVNDLILETADSNSDRKMTSLIISHDIKATLDISDYVAFLDHGKMIEYLPVKEFIESKHPLVHRFLELTVF